MQVAVMETVTAEQYTQQVKTQLVQPLVITVLAPTAPELQTTVRIPEILEL
jgi:hypothetical protein